MTMAAVTPTKRTLALTLDALKEAQSKLPSDLKVFTSTDLSSGASIKTSSGESILYVYGVLRHDERVKLTFSRLDNPFADAVVNFRKFDKNTAFAAALRIIVGNYDHRFRNKAAVASLVDKVGVPEIARVMPKAFADFMFASLHVFNCKLGVDRTVVLNKLREQIRLLVPHLSEEEVVRIYREEVVDLIHRL